MTTSLTTTQDSPDLLTVIRQLRDEVAVRKAAELAQSRTEDQLQEIISMMPLALFIKDADSRIVLMNAACEEMWGVPFAELSGNRGSGHFPPAQMEIFLANDRKAFAGRQQTVNEEYIWNARKQENRYCQTFKNPTYDADGKPLLLIAMCVDITERKRAEDALQYTLAQLRALSHHQHAVKEEERRQIALGVHDELGQNLMALKIDVAMLHARTSASHPRLHQRTGHALETLDASIKAVRNIINELHPSTLELGLCAAVEWLMKRIELRHGLRCTLQLIGASADCQLAAHQNSGIFRIVQAALLNICNHARASTVQVSLNLGPERLTIVITDDDANARERDQTAQARLDIKGIKERVAAFGGELVIARRHGSGSTMSILLPNAGQQAAALSA